MVPSWIETSYCLPVRLSVMVRVSAMSSKTPRRRARGPQVAPARRPRDTPRAAIARDPPSCTAHCRTAAMPDRPDVCGSTRSQVLKSATDLLYPTGFQGVRGLGGSGSGSQVPGSGSGSGSRFAGPVRLRVRADRLRIRRMMPDVPCRDHEDDVLGD